MTRAHTLHKFRECRVRALHITVIAGNRHDQVLFRRESQQGGIQFVEGGAFETLQIGQTVTYEEGQGPKGPRAENVRVAED